MLVKRFGDGASPDRMRIRLKITLERIYRSNSRYIRLAPDKALRVAGVFGLS